jgi:hypothetical protein
VRELFCDANPNFVCIQESKLTNISLFKAKTFLPRHLYSSITSVNAVGTRGGLITAWDPTLFTLTSHSSNQFCLSTSLSCNASNYGFTITNVYGPSDHSLTPQLLQCLRATRAAIQGAWILLGDFNLVRQPADKSNGIINSALADAFNQTIDELAITEVNLSDRRFTWTNKQFFAVLAMLDRVFTNIHLNQLFPLASLTSLPRPTSDHTPLLLSLSSNIPMSSYFRLENHLLKNESFLTSIVQAWHQALTCPDAAGQLVACIKSSRAAAKVWRRCNRAPPQIIQNYHFIIQLFDYFEEYRLLSAAEFQVCLKAQERLQLEIKAKAAYWRQRSKQKHIKAGDENTAYHHAQATNRMRRKFIRMIRVDGQEIVSHAGKTEALSGFFKSIIGVPGHAAPFDLDSLYVGSARPCEALSSAFSSDKLKKSVFAMNRLSAPRPDGFGPAFFCAAWSSVKDTVLAFADAFYNGTADLDRINRSHMVLLSKKPDAMEVNAFRPVCLQNCALKIISKTLTTRLQSEILGLIDIQ